MLIIQSEVCIFSSLFADEEDFGYDAVVQDVLVVISTYTKEFTEYEAYSILRIDYTPTQPRNIVALTIQPKLRDS